MPGYRILSMRQRAVGLRQWRCALERLTRSHNYFIATIVEGVARASGDREFLDHAGRLYAAKYPPDTLDLSLGPIFAVDPRVVLGITESK